MTKRVSVIWTKPALDSLLEVISHIKLDNPSAAYRLAATIKAKVTRLHEFPESGRIVPEFPSSGLREVIVQNHRIIYQIRQNPLRVAILAVRHGARLLPSPSDET